MMIDFKKQHMAITNQLFVVNAPVAIRDDAYDHDLGISSGSDPDGLPVKYDPSRRDNFGISVLQMARAYSAGLGFRLHSKEDLGRLIKIMEQYLNMADKSRRYINIRQVDSDEMDLVLEFGRNIVELNSDLATQQDLEVKRVVENVGTMNINVVADKVKANKSDKAASKRAKNNIVRFKPINF